jgi:hypothetical protein
MATNQIDQILEMINAGVTPEQIMAQRADAKALAFAQLSPEQQVSYNVGRGFGDLGKAVGSLFGAAAPVDPMLQQASKIRGLAAEFDTSTADGMMQYAKALQSVNPALAQQAAMKAREMKLTEAKITSEEALALQRKREKEAADPRAKFILANADKFTPDSLQLYSQSGEYTDLKPLTKEEKGVKPPADFLAVAVELGFGEKDKIGSYSSEQVKAINQTLLDRSTRKASAGASKVEVSVPRFDPKDAAGVLKVRKDLIDTVKPYREGIDAADNAISLLDAGIKQGNFAAVASAQRALAKAAGETQISAADVKAFGGDPSLIGMASDTISRLVTGTPTTDTLKQMKVVAKIMKKKNEERLKAEETMAKRTAARTGAFKEEDIADLFQLRTPNAPKQITLKSGIVVTRED